MKLIVLLLLVFGVFQGCSSKLGETSNIEKVKKIEVKKITIKDKIYGTWKYSKEIVFKNVPKEILKEFPKNVKLTASLKVEGIVLYDESGISNENSELSLIYRFSNDKGVAAEVVLKFKFEASSKWLLNNKGEIVETIIDTTKIIPDNDIAKKLLEENPKIIDEFSIIKGKLIKMKIISISQNTMILQNVDLKNDKEIPNELKNLKTEYTRIK